MGVILSPARVVSSSGRVAVAALLISLLGLFAYNVGIARSIQKNCRTAEHVKTIITEIIQPQVDKIKSGRLDEDYKRVYGTDPIQYKDSTLPRWQARKQEAIDLGNHELSLLSPDQCPLGLFPWEH